MDQSVESMLLLAAVTTPILLAETVQPANWASSDGAVLTATGTSFHHSYLNNFFLVHLLSLLPLTEGTVGAREKSCKSVLHLLQPNSLSHLAEQMM